MNGVEASRTGRSDDFSVHPEVGEIRAVVMPLPAEPVSRDQLYPGEVAASLESPADEAADAIAPLTHYLGPVLTVASSAWSGDPVPRMRALQKVLVEQSLKLAPDDRRVCLDAISVVERAVQLRLRLQQMRMSELEMDITPKGKPHAANA